MKSIITFFIISLNCLTLVGQSNIYLKTYHNSDFYDRSENLYDLEAQERLTTKHSISDFGRFSIALGLESNKSWYHEIELSYSSSSQPFEHESRVSENEKRNKEFLSLQYEINRQLLTKDNFKFSGGLAVNIYKSRTESITGFPAVPIFPVTDDYLGVTLNIIPRITYRVSKRVNIDLNTKL